MTPKIPLTIATAVAALAFAVPAGAQSSLGGCPEATTACQPVGDRPVGKPRSQDSRLRIQPRLIGNGTWQAGDHIMY